MESTDHELVQRFRDGERGSFECLVRRWDDRVLALAYRITGSAEDAEDVRQNAFIRVYNGLASFDGKAEFSTWLYRVVVNLCRDGLRSRGAGARMMERHADRQRRAQSTDSAPDAEGETSQVVAHAVEALPPDEREVLVLRHYHDMKFPQIADILGAPVTTLKSRMLRALQRLRDQLDPMLDGLDR